MGPHSSLSNTASAISSTSVTRTATARSPSKSGVIVSRFPTRASKTFVTASSLITSASRAERRRQNRRHYVKFFVAQNCYHRAISRALPIDPIRLLLYKFLFQMLLHTVACTWVEISKNRKETLFDKLIKS